MPAIKIKDKDGNWVSIPTVKGADGKSAYEAAVAAGYTGTKLQFSAFLANGPSFRMDLMANHFDVVMALETLAKAAGVAGPPIESYAHLLQQALKVYRGDDAFALEGLTLEAMFGAPLYLKRWFSAGSASSADLYILKRILATEPSSGKAWHEVQYRLIHGSWGTAYDAYTEGITNHYYWWKDGGTGYVVPLRRDTDGYTSLETRVGVLAELGFRYGVNDNMLAFDAMTSPADIVSMFRLFKSVPAGATSISEFTPYTDLEEFKKAVSDLVKLARPGATYSEYTGEDFTPPVLTWHQIQHYLLNPGSGYVEDADIPKEQYWWQRKDATNHPDTELYKLLKSMEAYIRSGNDSWVVTVAKIPLVNSCALRRTSEGTKFSSSTVRELPDTVDVIADNVKNTQYYSDGLVKLDWYQLQDAIINLGTAEIKSPADAKAAAAGYDWVPEWADSSVWPEFAGGGA